MLHRIKQFTALNSLEKKLFIEAYLTLGIMRFVILMVSFKRLVASLDHKQFSDESVTLNENESFIAQAVGRVVQKAANHTPWESACPVQTLTARKMLQKRNIPGRFYLGVAKGENASESMKAHAWLQCGNTIITGEEGHEQFTVLSVFSWLNK